MLKFNSKPTHHHQPTTKNNSPSIHYSKMDCICDNPKQQRQCSIHKQKNKMDDRASDMKIDEINFKQILQSILPQFCLQSMDHFGLNQNVNELTMSNEKRQKNGNKMHEIQIQMYGIWETPEMNKQKHAQIVCRKSLTNMKWECIDSIEVQSRYIIYAIGGQIFNRYLNADATVEISIIVYDKYTSDFCIVAENAVHLQLEYEYSDYLRVDLNKKVYIVTIKWINSNLLICGLSNGCVVLINVADLLTNNTTNVLVERLSVSPITQIKILTHNISTSLMDRIMASNHNLSWPTENVVIVLTKDQQLFNVNIVKNYRDNRIRYAMMIMYKYYILLGTQMASKYKELKQQRSRQTKNLTIIQQGQRIKIVQGSISGIIKIWMLPIEHFTANTKENTKMTKQFKKQNDEQKQKKEEQVKHKEEELKDIRSNNSKIKQNLQNFIILMSDDNQVDQRRISGTTEIKDTDTSHGNSQMEIQLSHDKKDFDQIDTIQNQMEMADHYNSQKFNFNHQSLISTYEQFSHKQQLHQNQSNEQVFVKAPLLRYSINPTSIIASLFYDSKLLELQNFGKFLICITANGFLTILAIDEDTCKRSQIQNEYRNNFFGQISEAYQIIMEKKIFVSKKEDEKQYEQYVGMVIKKRNLYVMINKIWERRKKIEEVQSYIKIIKIDQKYRITKIQVILFNTGANFVRNRNKISFFQIRESKIINDCFKVRHKKYQEGKKCKQILSDVFVASFQNSYLQRYMNVVVQSEHIYYEEQTRKDINQKQIRQAFKKQLSQYNKKYQINHWNMTDQYLSTEP